ncbi:MAG: DUF362 domain-containing protein [Deltaproteobacteria bacterium]|nr:DUF362 domain-containing protein [Deltaproteobacteria bacterium]
MSNFDDDPKTRLSRRDAIKLGSAGVAAGVLTLTTGSHAAPTADPLPIPGTGPGHVVKVHKPGTIGRWFPHSEAAKEMVDRAVTTLAGEDDLGRAWSKFVSKEDRVGIKINCLGGRFSSTMKEVVDPVVEGLRAAGVPDENIMIFDQYGGSMRGARYEWQDKPGKLRVLNNDALGYLKDFHKVEGARSKLAKTLTWTTAIINVPLLKDHDLAGVTCALKNMVFGCVEKPQIMHRDIHIGLPHFYALEEIRGRVRLNIVDGSFCLYDGGPKHNPKAHVRHETVYATSDPVAADAIALEVIEAEREAHKMRSLDRVRRPATYLALAQELGLGIADRDRINLETIELDPYEAPTPTT